MRKIVIMLLLMLTEVASAQFSFSISGEYYGCGKVTAELQRLFNQYAGSFQTSGIPTRTQCEQLRSQVNAINVYTGVCGFRLKASPCSGREMENNTNIGAQKINVQGAGQETSFFSTNSANEVRDWTKDVEERQRALDRQFLSPRTGDSSYDKAIQKALDKPFISLDQREGGTNTINSVELLSTDRLDYLLNETIEELNKKYEMDKGIDIDAILYKEPKTPEDIKIIAEYKNWLLKYAEESERVKDMSVLNSLVYVDGTSDLYKKTDFNSWYKETEYRRVKLDVLDENNPVFSLCEKIESFNLDVDNEGFHAELYYNEKSKEYSVVFRGSEELTEDIMDWITNFSQGLGFETKQYNIAIELGNIIKQLKDTNPDIKINITGHSLGGGLATIAGVISGQPTYVFNPAGVHENTFKQAGVWDMVQSGNFNIKRYSNEKDFLTNVQERSSVVGTIANIGAHAIHTGVEGIISAAKDDILVNKSSIENGEKMLNRIETALPRAIGDKETFSYEIDKNTSQMKKIVNNLKSLIPEERLKTMVKAGIKPVTREFEGHKMAHARSHFISQNNKIQRAVRIIEQNKNEEFKIYIKE